MTDALGKLGRLAEPSLLIMVALGDGPKHGYAIMTDVEAMSGSSLGPGTLYAALARLEARRLIEALPVDERRRPYRLTPAGAEALRIHLEGMREVARIGLGRLGGARLER